MGLALRHKLVDAEENRCQTAAPRLYIKLNNNRIFSLGFIKMSVNLSKFISLHSQDAP